jgi:hypothetical protein
MTMMIQVRLAANPMALTDPGERREPEAETVAEHGYMRARLREGWGREIHLSSRYVFTLAFDTLSGKHFEKRYGRGGGRNCFDQSVEDAATKGGFELRKVDLANYQIKGGFLEHLRRGEK